MSVRVRRGSAPAEEARFSDVRQGLVKEMFVNDMCDGVPRRGLVRPDVRQKVFERDGHRCLRCDATDDLTVDHVVPVSRGGRNTQVNLQTLCSGCNQWKADNSFDYRGWE